MIDPALRSIFLLKPDDLAQASKAHHPESALEVLLNPSNLSLRLYQVDANVTFKDRVEDYYDQLEKMYDYQVSGLRKKGGSPRSLLEGWDFQDLVHERDHIRPRHTILCQDGRSWVDFTRSLNTITLFGRDFGEILRPLGACAELSKSKPERSSLAATMVDLNNIMASKGYAYCAPMKLTQDVVWHVSEEIFQSCLSDEPGHKHRSHAMLSLLPSSMRANYPENPPISLPVAELLFWDLTGKTSGSGVRLALCQRHQFPLNTTHLIKNGSMPAPMIVGLGGVWVRRQTKKRSYQRAWNCAPAQIHSNIRWGLCVPCT